MPPAPPCRPHFTWGGPALHPTSCLPALERSRTQDPVVHYVRHRRPEKYIGPGWRRQGGGIRRTRWTRQRGQPWGSLGVTQLHLDTSSPWPLCCDAKCFTVGVLSWSPRWPRSAGRKPVLQGSSHRGPRAAQSPSLGTQEEEAVVGTLPSSGAEPSTRLTRSTRWAPCTLRPSPAWAKSGEESRLCLLWVLDPGILCPVHTTSPQTRFLQPMKELGPEAGRHLPRITQPEKEHRGIQCEAPLTILCRLIQMN